MRTVFIECEYFLTNDKHRAVLEDMKHEAGDDVRIVLLAPGMRVAEPASQWIPVSERLPDTDGELIFTIKQESGSKTVTGEYVKHSDGCRSWTWWDDLGQCTVFNETEYEDEDGKPSVLQEDGDEYYTFITAWMPMSLPEPYTEE